MAKKHTAISEMIAEQGYPEEVGAAVLAHVNELGTEEDILSGAKQLPTVHDATVWYERIQREETARRRRGGNS